MIYFFFLKKNTIHSIRILSPVPQYTQEHYIITRFGFLWGNDNFLLFGYMIFAN